MLCARGRLNESTSKDNEANGKMNHSSNTARSRPKPMP